LTCFVGGCPTGSTCRHSGIVGLCMYDAGSENAQKTLNIKTDSLITV
jgi:hypothetical protein